MTLKTIAADIRHYGAELLKEHGLEVVEVYSDEPDQYDDTIEFKSASGAKLNVKLQVSSLSAGSWDDAAICSYVYNDLPLGDTGFRCRDLYGAKPLSFLRGSPEVRVARLLQEVEKSGFDSEPVDSLALKVVTDVRMPIIVQALGLARKSIEGNSEIRFFEDAGAINRVALFCDDAEVIRVNLLEYQATVTNARDDSRTVSGFEGIQKAISDLSAAGPTNAPTR